MERNSEKSVVLFLQQDQPCRRTRKQTRELPAQLNICAVVSLCIYLSASPSEHRGRWGHLGGRGRNLLEEKKKDTVSRYMDGHTHTDTHIQSKQGVSAVHGGH